MCSKIDIGSSPRILITRLSAIGDCVHTLPLLHALRQRYANAHIAWATQKACAELIQGHPELNEVILIARDWYRSWRSIRETRSRLQSGRFDLSIDPQSLTKSSLLAWLAGARHRVGFSRGQAREISPWLSTARVTPAKTHMIERYLELLSPLGIKTSTLTFGLPVQPDADTSIKEFLQRTDLRDFALLNPGAGWDSKLWPHEHYASVAHHLHSMHQLPSVVLWAGDRERAWAEDIVKLAKGCALLAPDTSLTELAAICARAQLFVGSDTGPLHIAAALDTPCIGMYGPTRVCDCGPYGAGHEPLQAYYQDGSSRERRGADNRAMRAISVSSVNAACDRVIAWRAAPDRQQKVA